MLQRSGACRTVLGEWGVWGEWRVRGNEGMEYRDTVGSSIVGYQVRKVRLMHVV